MAKTYKVRPSELLDLSSSWDAFCFDRAVAVFGNSLSAELDGVEGKKKQDIQRKRQAIFDRWFPEAREQKKFRDPGSR